MRDNTGTLTGEGEPVQLRIGGIRWNFLHVLGVEPPDRPRLHRRGWLPERRARAAARPRPLAGALRGRPGDRGTLDRPRRPVAPRSSGCCPRASSSCFPARPACRSGSTPGGPSRSTSTPLPRFRWMRALVRLARRQPAAGPGRHRPPGAAAHLRDPRLQAAAVPPAGAPAARRPREPGAPDGARPVRRGRLRAAHRLRQRGEPAARAGRGARARARSARGAWGRAAPGSSASSSPKACFSPLAGAALGVLLAEGLIALLVRLAPADLPRFDAVDLDGRVLLFTLGASLLTVLVFALVPALQIVARRSPRGDQERGAPRGRGAPRARCAGSSSRVRSPSRSCCSWARA